MRKRINLSIEKEIYEKFQKYCRDNGMIPSRKIELFIKEELKNIK
ncbi:hypothetical protein J4426_02310 [Candidatus Woesearchaeota archaeon]|nr:hypothetical protein [Candidatus Woesearchaeota archaeon]